MPLTAKRLDDGLAVAPQITVGDIAEAAALGYRTIINNRPDHEDPGQLTAAEAAAAASSHGIAYVHIPVTSATMGPPAVESFSRALADHDGPILAHCRSGTRSTHLWAMSTAKAGVMAVDEIVARAGAAGYDLSALRPTLDRLAAEA